MIKQVTEIQVEQPHISANELAKYVFSTESEKKAILQNQKFPPTYRVSYYGRAQEAILGSFDAGRYREDILLDSAEMIASLPVKSPQEATKNKCNIEAIRHFCHVKDLAIPPVGDHQFIRRNAYIVREGVKISVRPEIVTSNLDAGFRAYTKLHFSKGKYSDDAAEIVLLLLLIYGIENRDPRMRFDLERTKLIECFSRTVIEGHRIADIRRHQLDEALVDIRNRWDQIKPRA